MSAEGLLHYSSNRLTVKLAEPLDPANTYRLFLIDGDNYIPILDAVNLELSPANARFTPAKVDTSAALRQILQSLSSRTDMNLLP